MTTAENPRAVAGANNPPEPIDPLIIESNERVDSANKWLTQRKEITDAEMADKAQFFISQVEGTRKALDDQRLQEGRDFKKQQDTKYGTPLSLLELAKTKLQDMRRAWLKKEDDRLVEERRQAEARFEAARKEAEEAEKRAAAEAKKKTGDPLRAEVAAAEAKAAIAHAEEAVAAVPERAQIKGAYTTKAVGLREYWSAEITDLSAAFKHYNNKKNPHKATLEAAIRDCIQKIADSEAKLHKDPAKAPEGISFKMEKR